METKLARIAEVAKAKPKERFTSLAHLLNKQMLRDSHIKLQAFVRNVGTYDSDANGKIQAEIPQG